jgi:four helix bundle protein
MLTLHRFDVYRVATELAKQVIEIAQRAPRGHGGDIDQLLRAAKAIVRNIAEGAGRVGVADKAKHYAIARGEAMECAGCIDLLQLEGVIDELEHQQAMELVKRIVQMLTKAIAKPA